MIYTIGEILILLIAAVLLGLLLGWLIWGRGRGDLHAECQQRLADAEGRLADAEGRLATATTDRDATAAKLASIEEGHGAAAASADAELKALRTQLEANEAALESAKSDLVAARADVEGAEMARDEALASLEAERASAASAASAAAAGGAVGGGMHFMSGSGRGDDDSAAGDSASDDSASAESSDGNSATAEASATNEGESDELPEGVDDTKSALGFSAAAPVAGVAANTAPDDLEDIVGVGPKLNALLIERGITTFRQVAVMTDDEVDLLDDSLPDFNGRVRRENWVRQAGELHLAKYGSAAVR